MADYKIVQKLDEKLIADGIIDAAYKDDYRKVHSRLNAHYKKSGAVLPAEMFDKNETRLRKWLGELYKKGASQERLTCYLRCGLAHLSFDFIESSYKSIGNDDLVTRALLSFKSREFHKTYYKATDTAILVKKKRTIKIKSARKIKSKKTKDKPKKKITAVKKVLSAKAKPKKKVKKPVKKTTRNKRVTVTKKSATKKNTKSKSSTKKKHILKIKLFR
ncbi:MAG: hypothetical protein V1874_05890 [Spirochaetota bacterium]